MRNYGAVLYACEKMRSCSNLQLRQAVALAGCEHEVRVTFDEPQRAITPGQAVVFYDGD